MKVKFQPTSAEDVRWFSRYYQIAFRAGQGNARARLENVLRVLADNPYIGHPTGDGEEREFSIPRTPFSLVYRIRGDRIEILRLWDQRREETTKKNWNREPGDS